MTTTVGSFFSRPFQLSGGLGISFQGRKAFDVMAAVKKAKAVAPIRIGDVLVASPAGTACNIIATRHVEKAKHLTRF